MKTFGKKVALWPKDKLEKSSPQGNLWKVAHKETFGKKGSSHGSLWKKGSTKDFDKCPVNLLEKRSLCQKGLNFEQDSPFMV